MAKISRYEAYRKAKRAGVSFNEDFYAQSKGNVLAELAKQSGYRKGKNAPGSTGRMFFYHLQKLKKKRGWH